MPATHTGGTSATAPNTGSVTWVLPACAYKVDYMATLWPDTPTTTPKNWAYNPPAFVSLPSPAAIHNVHLRSVCSFATTPYSVWVSDSVQTPFPASISAIQDGVLTAYPNPATDRFYVEAGEAGISEISLTDVYGKVLLRSTLQPKERKEIDLMPYPTGVYILHYQNTSGTASRKIKKQ